MSDIKVALHTRVHKCS